MADDPFEERRKALEEAFFKKQDRALLDRLRHEARKETAKQSILQATGIRDERIVSRLAGLGFDAASLLAFALVPEIEVAWADGVVDEKERESILARVGNEIPPGSPAYQMIASWLERRPLPELFETWIEYAKALCAGSSAADREWLRQGILGRSAEIAEASGGLLGVALKRSRSEAAVLRRIEEAFAG